MRATGKDITELFGFSPDDISAPSLKNHRGQNCPFTGNTCSKTNHDQSVVYGVCSVTNGITSSPETNVIICPNRLYANDYQTLKDVVDRVWPNKHYPLIIGGTLDELRDRANKLDECVIAFGKGSGKEIAVDSNGPMSLDWVLQLYTRDASKLIAKKYIGVEVQSIDITGNYRENWSAYNRQRLESIEHEMPPSSGHGLNWANVIKRLMQQIIRKGNIYKSSEKCAGFFFIVPDIVYSRFENVLGEFLLQKHQAMTCYQS